MIFGMTVDQIFLYFVMYSFLGWCLEVAYHALHEHKVINRGFLNGPVCPVYGFGMLTVLSVNHFLKSRSAQSGKELNVLILFLVGSCLATIVELIGGFLLDYFFHARWWDYRNRRFNFHGYICLEFSLIWGAGIVFVVRFVHNGLGKSLTELFPQSFERWMLLIIYLVMITDFVVSVLVMLQLNRELEELDEIRRSLRSISDSISLVVGEGTFVAEDLLDGARPRIMQSAPARTLKALKKSARAGMEVGGSEAADAAGGAELVAASGDAAIAETIPASEQAAASGDAAASDLTAVSGDTAASNLIAVPDDTAASEQITASEPIASEKDIAAEEEAAAGTADDVNGAESLPGAEAAGVTEAAAEGEPEPSARPDDEYTPNLLETKEEFEDKKAVLSAYYEKELALRKQGLADMKKGIVQKKDASIQSAMQAAQEAVAAARIAGEKAMNTAKRAGETARNILPGTVKTTEPPKERELTLIEKLLLQKRQLEREEEAFFDRFRKRHNLPLRRWLRIEARFRHDEFEDELGDVKEEIEKAKEKTQN